MSTFNIVVAGIFAIPPLLISICTIPVIGILSIPSIALLLSKKYVLLSNKNNNDNSTAKHPSSSTTKFKQIIITGGSSGIGLAIGKEAARRYDVNKIILIARDIDKLETAKKAIMAEIETSSSSTKLIRDIPVVDIYSVDVRNADTLNDVAKKIMTLSNNNNTISRMTHLFICAGQPYPIHHEDITTEMYSNAVAVNQLGSIYTSSAFLSYMKDDDRNNNGGGGTITFCSSLCGLIGVYGYAAYCPTKYALRGFVECLYNELQSYQNIYVQLAFPSDTDTPGYELENKTKPVETQLISDTSGLHTANHVGTKMYHEAVDYTTIPKFYVTFTFDGWLLGCILNSSFTPIHTIWEGIAQITLLPITRWIALFITYQWNIIISSYQNKSKIEQMNIEKKLFPDRFPINTPKK